MHSVDIPVRFAHPVSHYPHRPEVANDISTRADGIQNHHYRETVIERKASGPNPEDENIVLDKNKTFNAAFSFGVHGPLSAAASLDLIVSTHAIAKRPSAGLDTAPCDRVKRCARHFIPSADDQVGPDVPTQIPSFQGTMPMEGPEA